MSDDNPKVVSLRNGQEIIPPGEAIPQIVADAEEFLERARSGDIKGFALVFEHWDHTVSQRSIYSSYSLIGGMEWLKQKMLMRY